MNRKQWRWRERESERHRGRGERERERGTPPTKLFRLGRLCGLFTNRTRFSNPGSPNLTSKHQGTPDWENREREITKKKQQKLCVIIFLASVHTVAPLPSPPPSPPPLPLPHRFVASFGLYFFFFWRRDIHGKKGKKLVHHHHHHHSYCPTHVVVSSLFFSSSCLCTLARR